MTKSIYATAKESASVMKPDTRTNAEKILYELQKEQTYGFEMGNYVDNGAIALKLIEQNLEILAMLRKIAESGDWYCSALEFNHNVDGDDLEEELLALIAKATGQSK